MTVSPKEPQLFLQELEKLYAKKLPHWPLRSISAGAWKSFSQMGLPTKKWEAFQYLPLLQMYRFLPKRQESTADAAAVKMPQGISLLVKDGSFCPELSQTSALPKEVVVLPLSKAMGIYGTILANRMQKLQQEEKNPFALVNQAIEQEGIFIYVPPHIEVKDPVSIYYTAESGQAVFPKVQIFMGKGASMRISVSCHSKEDSWTNALMDISLDEGASLTRCFSALPNASSPWIFESVRAALKRDSRFHSYSLTSGSKTVREDLAVALEGENAEADLKGIWMLGESRQSHTHILVAHRAPYCRSNQHFKGVNASASKSSFEGKIYVKAKAQKTEGYQLNNNLLLSKKAEANAKPNLEIFADDVKASHGATISKLNEEELFYLKTRGLSLADAASYLVKGFCREILQQMPDRFMRESGEKVLNEIIRHGLD